MPKPAAAFADRLADAIDASGSPACVGIDPFLDRLPAAVRTTDDIAAVEAFCLGVVDAVAGVVPAVKPQSACFERFGSAGVAVLERVIARANDAGLLVVLDAKRGDIGSTSDHYAAAATGMGAHCITVNAYLGLSGIEPFLNAGLGVYALVRTSNPDSDAIQSPKLESGRTVAEHVAAQIAELGRSHIGKRGISAVGAVVGATKATDAGAALRAIMPDQPFLVPGVGAQGGSASDVQPLTRPHDTPGDAGVLVNASRSVLYPADASVDWADAIHGAAIEFTDLLRPVVAG